MALSREEKERYLRQLTVPSWSQEKLKRARVLVVGVGGLGCASSLYLAHAGVGKLRLCDPDRVETSDLNRQVLYAESSLGKLKVEEAKKRLRAANSRIEVETLAEPLTPENAAKMTKGCSLFLDGLDNMETRFLLNAWSVRKGIPYLYAAVRAWEGLVGLFSPPRTACLACLLPRPPEEAKEPPPVFGGLPGTIGLLQAVEALKVLLGVEKTLEGNLLIFDSRALTFDLVEVEKNPLCPVCSHDIG